MDEIQRRPLNPASVLGVAAHADDLDFSSAGTIAKLARQGAEIYYLILTDGGKGSADLQTSTADLIKLRQQEQRDAARALGVKDVFFLSYEDGRLEITADLKRDIVRYIRRLKPELVTAFDPSVLYVAEQGIINHPDHRACGQAVLDAVFPLARDHLSFPELYSTEGLEPHKVSTLLLSNFKRSNYAVDISETLHAKMDAIKAHVSQVSDIEAIVARFTERAAEAGKQAGFMHAELFVRIDIPA